MSLALPERPEPAATLAGRYLFGRMFYKEFGHFIIETIGRLWANDNRFDGIVMTPRHAHLTGFPGGSAPSCTPSVLKGRRFWWHGRGAAP